MDHRVALAGFPGRVATLLFAVLVLALVTPAAAAGANDDSVAEEANRGADDTDNSDESTEDKEELQGKALEFLARRVVYERVCSVFHGFREAKEYVTTDEATKFNAANPIKEFTADDVSRLLQLNDLKQEFDDPISDVLEKVAATLKKPATTLKKPATTLKTSKTSSSGLTPNEKLGSRVLECLEYLKQSVQDVDQLLTKQDDAQVSVSRLLRAAYSHLNDDSTAVTDYLIGRHDAYKDLNKWASTLAGIKDSTQKSTLHKRRNEVQSQIHDIMGKHGLYQPLAAQLVAGVVLTDGGADNKDVDGKDTQNSQANAHVVWSSRYYDMSPEKWSFSFGGKIGIQPTMTLVKPAASKAGENNQSGGNKLADGNGQAAGEMLSQKYQSAFVWSLSPKFSFHPRGRSGRSELSLAGSIGQVRLLEDEVVVKEGGSGKPSLAIPLNGKTEWFFEGGLAYRLFNTSIKTIQAQKTQLAPLFELELLLRRDNRFKKTGALVGFDSPARRLIFRFALNGLQVIDKRPDSKRVKPFTLSFGIEHERALGGDTVVPSGTRFFIRGDLNLIKAIRGS